MRVQRKIWILFVFIALMIAALCVFTGCATNQPASNSNQQPPVQQQEQNSQAQQQQQAAPQSTPATVPVTVPTNEEPAEKALPILENANFEMGHYGWSPQDGTIETEYNGNKYMTAGYTWGLYQFLQVKPGESYQIYGKVKQGMEPASPARLSIIFYDRDHKIMTESQNYVYNPGYEWSSFPKKVFKVPENALFTKLFLLSNGKGTVCFDNISISLTPRETTPAAPGTTQ